MKRIKEKEKGKGKKKTLAHSLSLHGRTLSLSLSRAHSARKLSLGGFWLERILSHGDFLWGRAGEAFALFFGFSLGEEGAQSQRHQGKREFSL